MTRSRFPALACQRSATFMRSAVVIETPSPVVPQTNAPAPRIAASEAASFSIMAKSNDPALFERRKWRRDQTLKRAPLIFNSASVGRDCVSGSAFFVTLRYYRCVEDASR
jgi:hypothetical protein